MKKIVAVCLLTLVTIASVTAQEWQTDFAKAKKIAAAESKPIILVFQGSDWCAPCIKLDREVWSTAYFKTYAAKHYVMLKADFPRKKGNALPEEQSKANAILAETYNKQGYFPFVVVLNSDGKVLGESSYKKITPEDYIKQLDAFLQIK